MPGDLAGLALAEVGQLRYVFGGAPNNGGVDCSSFISLLIGKKLGLAIPGFKRGTYTGATHGPVVLEYAVTSLAQHVNAPPSPGDLCIWPGAGPLGHIGVAISGTRMVSALNPSKGVANTPIHGYGPPGVAVIFRRYKAAGDGGLPWDGSTSGPITTTAGPALTGCVPAMVLWPVLIPLALYRRRHDGGV